MAGNNKVCCTIDNENVLQHEEHNHEDFGYWPAIISFVLLLSGLVLEYILKIPFFKGSFRISWYLAAYIPVAYPVIREAIETLKKREIFTEFFLMSLATIGAFAIGEYPEGVAVMLFYTIGELFQGAAVKKAKDNITALLDVRSDIAMVFRNNSYEKVHPEEVVIGEKIEVKAGERVPLDGTLLSTNANLNTVALTGESKPQTLQTGGNILAGSINLSSVIEVEVKRVFSDSSISRILDLVQNATTKKAKTELLIRKLAKIYTPIVVYLALGVCFIPYLFVEEYVFSDWLYKALIFLVISCPCALVISIPLGYFGGLGAASKNGILFKGATYLDQITKINTLIMDKTGTLTKGVFVIKDIRIHADIDELAFMNLLMALESKSNHPIAKAILEYGHTSLEAHNVTEIAGKGLSGDVDDKHLLAGNQKLMDMFNVVVPSSLNTVVDTMVLVAIDKKYAGYITIADELKSDAKTFVQSLSSFGISDLIMLSGDRVAITKKVALELGIKKAIGGLLPEDKLSELLSIKNKTSKKIAFVGDGINDAPVLAASDIGIAMGAMGSDVAIETADIIIQTDEPSKILTAIKIGRSTQDVIWQNIYLSLGVKILVLILGVAGMATMWEAVFADVGVALLAILNAIRIQKKDYSTKAI